MFTDFFDRQECVGLFMHLTALWWPEAASDSELFSWCGFDRHKEKGLYHWVPGAGGIPVTSGGHMFYLPQSLWKFSVDLTCFLACWLSGFVGDRRLVCVYRPHLEASSFSFLWRESWAKLFQPSFSYCILQRSHHATCQRPGGLCTIRMHSWPNSELCCYAQNDESYNNVIAVLAFCLLAGGCPIFRIECPWNSL